MTISRWLDRISRTLRAPKRPNRRTTRAGSGEALEQRQLLTKIVVDYAFDEVDPNDGVTSLREALAMAADEVNYPGHDEIVFSEELAYASIHRGYSPGWESFNGPNGTSYKRVNSITGESGEFVIDSDVTIDASDLGFVRIGHDRGETLDGRIFRVVPGVSASIVGVFIQGADSNGGNGAGILNQGNLTLKDVAIGGNFALGGSGGYLGGGIYNAAGATLTLENSHIGEIGEDDQFLTDQGFDVSAFVEAEDREKDQFQTFQYRGEVVVAKSTDDTTVLTGNGAYGNGGGIYNAGTAHLTNTVVRANRVEGFTALGAGLYNAGTMTLTKSIVENHDGFAQNNESGANEGAGIYNAAGADLTITDSQIRNNVSPSNGAGIFNAGTLTATRTALSGNQAKDDWTPIRDYIGGGLYNIGTASFTRSSFAGNSATQDGGGIFNGDGGNLLLDHVTLADNVAGDDGGGLSNQGTAELLSSTVAHNTAGTNSNFGNGGGIYNVDSGGSTNLTLEKTVVGSNTSDLSSRDDIGNSGNVGLISQGFNLVETAPSSGGYMFTSQPGVGDSLGLDAHLGLAVNFEGGIVAVPVLPSSPAIDVIPTSLPVHTYELNGDLSDETGAGADLVSHGGTLLNGRYEFGLGEGLTVNSPGIANDEYTIDIEFRWSTLGGSLYKKILDFENLLTDTGIYARGTELIFWDNGIQAQGGEFIAGQTHQLTLTRRASTKELIAYLDGVEVFSHIDTNDGAVLAGPNSELQLFRDDRDGNENGTGFIYELNLYDHVFAEPPGLTDQRGSDRLTGPAIDIGAYESEPLPSMRISSLEDAADGFYGEGELSLREAILWANQIPGPDEIAFDEEFLQQLEREGIAATIDMAETGLGEMLITDDLTIRGPGVDVLTISGGNLHRIFNVDAGVSFTLTDATLTEGHAASAHGGAILSQGDVSLRQVHATANTADGHGGAIWSSGSLTLDGVTLSDNISDFDNTTSSGAGGALYATGATTVVNSTVSGNIGDNGAGLFFTGSETMVVHNSTIVLNTASNLGGGFRTNADIEISNSIVALNSAATASDVDFSSTAGTITSQGYNVIGTGNAQFVDGVNNDQAGSTADPLDPLIGKLRPIGNGIPLHGLLPGSPAIEAANPIDFPRFDQRGVARPVDVNPDTGAFEYVDPAYTVDGSDVIVTVDSLDGFADGAYGPGELSLLEATLFVNATPQGGNPKPNTIVFADDLFTDGHGTIEFDIHDRPGADTDDHSGLHFTSPVDIIGPGADRLTVKSIGDHRVFTFADGAATDMVASVSGMAITGGSQASQGGGIFNEEELFIDGVYVHDNHATFGGGGIYNTGMLTVDNSTTANNTAVRFGGGFHNSDGDAILRNVTVSGNTAEEGGGIMSNANSDTTLRSVTITDNHATDQAGGIFVADWFLGSGYTYIASSLIAGNTSTVSSDVGTGAGVVSEGHNVFGTTSDYNFHTATDSFGSEASPLVPFITDLALPAQAKVPVHALLPEADNNPAENVGGTLAQPTDARGIARNDGLADAGAFELAAIDRTQFTWESELVVDKWEDTLDAVYVPGQMTLREAIILANAYDGTNQRVVDGVAYDIIRFSDELLAELAAMDESERALKLRRGQLQIDGNVILDPFFGETDPENIDRDVVVIDGDDLSRVFRISTSGDPNGVNARLSNLSVTNGRETAAGADGGAILSYGDVALTNVSVTDSETNYNGGGIAGFSGSVVIQHSMISGNDGTVGGGIWTRQHVPLFVSYSEFANNHADFGAGIGTYNVTETTSPTSGVHLEIVSSTIAENTAEKGGGGIYAIGDTRVSNSTVSGNVVDAEDIGDERGGGGILFNAQPQFTLTIDNSTIVYNAAVSGGRGGGVRANIGGQIELANTVMAFNQPEATPGGGTPKVGTPLTSLGNNLFDVVNGNWLNQTSQVSSDQFSSDPKIGPLAANGGPTRTHLLMADSPAIDAGNETYMPLLDQRGRPLVDIPADKIVNDGGSIPDIGSYEVQGVGSSRWRYEAFNQSQFGPGEALTFGFGFDDGRANSDVRPEPHFLGFEFDTGPKKWEAIETNAFGSFGGGLTADFSGKFGFDVGFYVNSGSVDVAYDGDVNYVLDAGPDYAGVTAYANVSDGVLQTISPKVGAYLDVVTNLHADVTAKGCLFGCVTADLLDIHFDQTTELFGINRQLEDSQGRPIFSDANGDGVARATNGSFYDLDGNYVGTEFSVGPVVPLLSGELNYFGIDPFSFGENEDDESKEDKARRALEGRKATQALEKAKADRTRADDFLDYQNKKLAAAVERQENPKSGKDFIEARAEVERLAGKEYADAVDTGTTPRPLERGEIETARDSSFNAWKKERDAQNDLDDLKRRTEQDNKKKKEKTSVSNVGVTVNFQEADGALLGGQANFGVGAEVSRGRLSAGVTKNIGSAAVTLPDVNLGDTQINSNGLLSASTDDFELNSAADNNRQFAKASLDLAALVPVIPGGSYSLSAGPLSLDVTTVSYKLEPQLNVTQDVSASYEKVENGMTYSFFQVDGVTEIFTDVKINGVMHPNVHTVTFSEGDNVIITGIDYMGDAGNDQIVVMPTMSVKAKFRNDIGLEVDLDGAFEAFALRLAAFDIDIVDIGPLIKHNHNLARFGLGDVFNETFELPTETVELEPFVLFDQINDGRTAAAALMAQPTETANEASKVIDSVHTGPPVTWVGSDLVNLETPGTYFQTLDIIVTGPNVTVEQVQVIEPQLTVTQTGSNTFTIDGYTESRARQQSLAPFALTFSTGEGQSATVTTTRRNPAQFTDIEGNTEDVSDNGFDTAGVKGVFNNDIDDNGVVDPETDGVLVIRALAGFTGQALIDGALGEGANRTDPFEIADYVNSLRNAQYVDEAGETVRSLDIDGNDGTASALGDGIMLSRFMAGLRGGDLTADVLPNNATRTSPEEIENWIRLGKDRNDDTDGNVGEEVDTENEEPVVDTSLAGSSPTSAFIGTDLNGPEHQRFTLTTFGDNFTINEHYYGTDATGDLASRVSEGAPSSFSTDARKDLLQDGGEEQSIFEQQVTGSLGVDEPVYIQGIDGAVIGFSALDGATFNTVTLNPRANGNVYQPTRYDLYLWNNTFNEWQFDRLVTDSDPTQLSDDGNVTIALDAPTDRFRLYAHPTANAEVFDPENLDSPDLSLAVGFTLNAGTQADPRIQRDVYASRASVTAGGPVRFENPVFASDTAASFANFEILRDNAGVIVSSSLNGDTATPQTFPIGSTRSIFIEGHDNVSDTLTIVGSGLQTPTPIIFDAGFRTDSVVVTGDGLVLDLVDRSKQQTTATLEQAQANPLILTNVEVINLTGSGDNTLLLDFDAVVNNDTLNKQLFVNGNAGDTANIGSGWNQIANETINGLNYEVFTQGEATLFIQTTVNVIVSGSSSGGSASLLRAGENNGETTRIVYATVAPVLASNSSSTAAGISLEQSSDSTSDILVDIAWDPINGQTITEAGLHVRVHYNSEHMTFTGLENAFANGYSTLQDMTEDETNDDGNEATDRFVNVLWFDTTASWTAAAQQLLGSVRFEHDFRFEITQIHTRAFTTGGEQLTDQVIDIVGLPSVPVIVDELGLLTNPDRTPGNVIVVTQGPGLAIVPDDNDNAVHVFADSNGHVIVRGLEGTTINGQSHSVFFPGSNQVSGILRTLASTSSLLTVIEGVSVGGISATGGATQDGFELHGTNITGATIINLAGGNDSLLINNATTTEKINVDLGDDDDSLTLANSMLKREFSVLKTGLGNDSVNLDQSVFEGPLTIDLQDGADELTTSALHLKSTGSFKLGGGDDQVTISGIDADQQLSIIGASGVNEIRIDDHSNFDSTLTVNTGLNSNLVEFDTTTIGGALNINSSTGSNDLRLNTTTLTGQFNVNAASSSSTELLVNASQLVSRTFVTTGAGTDSIAITNSDLLRSTVVRTHGGDDSVLIHGGEQRETLSIYLGDAGATADMLTIHTGQTITGNLNIRQLENAAIIQLADAASAVSVGGITSINTGNGNDIINLTDVHLQNALYATLGAGDNVLNVNQAIIDGAVIITGAQETDVVSISQSTLNSVLRASLLQGSDSLTLDAGTTVLGKSVIQLYTGDDTLTLDSVILSESILHGGANNDTYNLQSVEFTANAVINGADGDDHVIGSEIQANAVLSVQGGRNQDTIDLNDLTTNTLFYVAPGTGNDITRIQASQFNDSVNISPAGGNNVVDLDGNTFEEHLQLAAAATAPLAVRNRNNLFRKTTNIFGSATAADVYLDDGTSTYETSGANINGFEDTSNEHIDAAFADLLDLLF